MYHAACKVEFQPFTVLLTADVFQLFIRAKRVSNWYIPKKNVCACARVPVCSSNLGFSVENTNLGFSVGYVLCASYVCTWYQPAEITSCEKHSMVVYIYTWTLPMGPDMVLRNCKNIYQLWTRFYSRTHLYRFLRKQKIAFFLLQQHPFVPRLTL